MSTTTRRPAHQHTTTAELPRLPGRLSNWSGALLPSGFVIVVGVIVMAFFAQQYVGSVFVISLTYAVVTAGMAVQIGFSQQVAFSQSVFMGLGAYGVAVLNADVGISSLLATVIVTIGSGIVAILIGRIVTKAPGLALAVATIMFPIIAIGYLGSAGYLGGSIGMSLTGNLYPSGSINSTVVGNGLIVVGVIALVVFIGSRILSSDIGLELFTLGVNEGTAAAMGVSTTRRKLELFVVGSMLASLGGSLYAGTQLFVPASLVGVTTELSLLMMLFIGGRRSVIGAVIGAFALEYIQGASNFVSIHILIIEGVLITVVLLIEPEGLAGIARSLTGSARKRLVRAPLVTGGVTGVPVAGAGLGAAGLGATAPGAVAGVDSEPELRTPRGASGTSFATSWAARVERQTDEDPHLFACSGINKEYGGLKVLHDVGFELASRGVFGLCGPNGAGKTTLLNVIGGSTRPSSGTVLLGGRDVTGLPPSARFHLGVARTFQAVNLIRGRTVVDNVAVACLDSNGASITRGIVKNRLGAAREKAMEALDFLGMASLSGQEVSSLTLERQRMVELARAVASKPKLLLLDEPASGLSEAQRAQLQDVLRAIGKTTCVVLVEHDLGLVASIADKIFVLASGAMVFEGSSADFKASALVGTLLMGV